MLGPRLAFPLALAACLASCRLDRPFAPENADILNARSTAEVTNLSASAVSPSRIDIHWRESARNETGFELHRSTTGLAGTFVIIAWPPPNATSYSDGGLIPASTYCYKVRSVRWLRSKPTYSAFSSIACATTPLPPPPPVPTGVDATANSSTTVNVRWTSGSAYLTEFRGERSLDHGTTWAAAFTASASERLAVDVGRSSEEEVCYRVTAFYQTLASAPSAMDCTTPPAAPTELTGNVTWLGDCCVTLDLAWTDKASVEDGYEIWTFYWGAEGPVPILEARLAANSTSYHTEFYSGWPYYVYAVKDGGRSDGATFLLGEP